MATPNERRWGLYIGNERLWYKYFFESPNSFFVRGNTIIIRFADFLETMTNEDDNSIRHLNYHTQSHYSAIQSHKCDWGWSTPGDFSLGYELVCNTRRCLLNKSYHLFQHRSWNIVASFGTYWRKVSIGFDNSLAPSGRQTTKSTGDYPTHWFFHSSLGLNVLHILVTGIMVLLASAVYGSR